MNLNKFYSPNEIHYKLKMQNTFKSDGHKFEDLIFRSAVYIKDEDNFKKISDYPLYYSNDNPLIRDKIFDNGIVKYSLGDATITDFSNVNDEIEVKYYYGKNNQNIYLPIDKLTSNKHFDLIFCIKDGLVKLYNIYCKLARNDGLYIGYINKNFYKNLIFIVAMDSGTYFYDFTEDLLNNKNYTLTKTNAYPKIHDEDLYILDSRGIGYKQDIIILNDKIKPIVYIPIDKFKEVYILKDIVSYIHWWEQNLIIDPLDFDKDEDFYIDYKGFLIRKRLI